MAGSEGYQAFIERRWDDPLEDVVRLHVITPFRVDRHRSYLTETGAWYDAVEGMQATASGIVLPREALKAIVLAIKEFRGDLVDESTEAKVLREWLAVERRRVDEVLHPYANVAQEMVPKVRVP